MGTAMSPVLVTPAYHRGASAIVEYPTHGDVGLRGGYGRKHPYVARIGHTAGSPATSLALVRRPNITQRASPWMRGRSSATCLPRWSIRPTATRCLSSRQHGRSHGCRLGPRTETYDHAYTHINVCHPSNKSLERNVWSGTVLARRGAGKARARPAVRSIQTLARRCVERCVSDGPDNGVIHRPGQDHPNKSRRAQASGCL
jgi:hypothetical protein